MFLDGQTNGHWLPIYYDKIIESGIKYDNIGIL